MKPENEMRTLRAIGEIHATNTLYTILEKVDGQTSAKFWHDFSWEWHKNPLIVSDAEFWVYFEEMICNALPPQLKTDKFGNYDLKVRAELAGIRATYARELDELSKGYTRLFIEGSRECPVSRHAKNSGMHVTYLGKGLARLLRRLDSLPEVPRVVTPEKIEKLAREMKTKADKLVNQIEIRWAEKINSFRGIDTSLLIAGAAHVNNEYGLVQKLLDKGIQLRKLD